MSRARKALFALIVLLVALGGLELAARPYAPPFERTLPLPGPSRPDDPVQRQISAAQAAHAQEFALYARKDVGWALPPATEERMGDVVYRYNSLGFRGPEITPLAEGEVRLFTVGDSSTFGHGVSEEYVYGNVAAARLAEGWGRPVSVFNGAVPGHDTQRSRSVLTHLGPPAEPGWVVVGNLWSDLIATPDPTEQSPLRRSAFVRLLEEHLAPWMRPVEVRWLQGPQDAGSVAGPHRVSVDTYRDNLRALAKGAQALGARVAYVMLPAPLDLDRMPPPESVAVYRDAMRTVAEEVGAPLVDGPALLHEKGGDLAWFMDSVHPSVLGHVRIGEALAAALAPSPPPAVAHRYGDVDLAALPGAPPVNDPAINHAGPGAMRNLPDGTKAPLRGDSPPPNSPPGGPSPSPAARP